MKVLSVGEFKANFSEILKTVLAGEEVGISYGKKKACTSIDSQKTKEKNWVAGVQR